MGPGNGEKDLLVQVRRKTVISFAHSIGLPRRDAFVCRDGLVQRGIPCLSECSSWPFTYWDFVKNAHLFPHPDLLSPKLSVSKSPGDSCAGLDELYPEVVLLDSVWTGQPLRMYVASQKTPGPRSQAGINSNLCSTTF